MMRAVFQVVAPINRLLDTVPFNLHCYSLDWHPSDHVSFIDNVHLRALARDSQVSQSDLHICWFAAIVNTLNSYFQISQPNACKTYDKVMSRLIIRSCTPLCLS